MWWFVATALAGPQLQVTVLYQQQPVTNASVVIAEEGERHRVNSSTGQYVETVGSLPDGSELPYRKGAAYTVRVGAPGMQTIELAHVQRKNKEQLVFELTPLTPVPLDCAPEALRGGRDQADALLAWATDALSQPGARTPEQTLCLTAARAVATHRQVINAQVSLLVSRDEQAQSALAAVYERAREPAQEWTELAARLDAHTELAAQWCRPVQPLLESCR